MLFLERLKLIKIADRSELGWAVVNEHTANELAEAPQLIWQCWAICYCLTSAFR